jgi:YesN/AraC family two-component response regulator
MKLIIADDEDNIRNGMAKYIELHGSRFHPVYLAENGQQAIDLIFMHHPELMLLDVSMPAKNGLDVMKEAYQAGIAPATIILSGYGEFSYAQKALRYGVREYLLKPCRSSDILNKLFEIADAIQGKRMQPPSNANPMVEKAKGYIDEHYYEKLTLQRVADELGITPGYLSTLFSMHGENGFVDFLNMVRIGHACLYLGQNYLKTYEIAYKVGFQDEKYFSKVFKKLKGVSPSEYRKGEDPMRHE